MTKENNISTNITTKQYQTLKRSLIHKENTNTNRIYFIPCTGDKGWYEIAEHSALFYYYEVVKRNGLKNKFFDDALSFFDPYSIGYLRISSIDEARTWLKKSKLYSSEGYDSKQTFYIELTKTFDKPTIDHYIEKERLRRIKELSITPANNLSPEYYQLLANTGRRIYQVISGKITRLAANTIGAEIAIELNHALEYYHHIAHFKKQEAGKTLSKWNDIRTSIYNVLIKIEVLSDYKLINYQTSVGICEQLRRIIAITEKEITKLAKAERSKANGNHTVRTNKNR